MFFKYTLTAFVAAAICFSGNDVYAQPGKGNGIGKGNGDGNGNGNGNGKGKGNLELGPNDSIGAALMNEHANGNMKPKFKIKTSKGNGANGGNGANAGSTIEVDVVEGNNAVTPETRIKFQDGSIKFAGDNGKKLLVADLSEGNTDDFVLLSVDVKTDEVQGVISKKGQNAMKFKKRKGNASWAEDDTSFVPPAWECGVNHGSVADEMHGFFERRALGYHDDHGHEEAHEHDRHHDHDHDHHHDHDHEHDHHHHGEDLSLDSIRHSLRGSNVQIGKRRRLQTGGSYSFQVDMYIEVDTYLVSLAGSEDNAVDYVNNILTGANTIYEYEIDTHLNVHTIAFTTIYDGASNPSDALSTMVSTYQPANGWHTAGVDLHHGFLGKELGGGVAYLGVVCNSNYGFGVSASLSGNQQDIGAASVWDLIVVMHEIGHNFDSDHTHDYSPAVDTCGNTCSGLSVPTGGATIMSYCHLCSGSYNNIAYTFGGEYDGSGDKSSINNWITNPDLASKGFSNDARRVSKTMYDHVSSQGSCVAVSNTPAPTPNPTPNPTLPNTPTNPPTPQPTPAPVPPTPNAVYDGSMGAPRCTGAVASCDSNTLLVGRGSITGAVEPNLPNTRDTCTDGNSGSYEGDESLDRIVVTSVDGNPFRAGSVVSIEATVFAWSTGASDYADFYYTSDASSGNPAWTLIARQKPPSGGWHTLTQQYTLPSGGSSMQAVRVVFKYSSSTSNSATPCPGGSYDDVDDLAFPVSLDSAPTNVPTLPPTNPPTNPPSNPPTNPPTPNPTPQPTPNPTPQPTPAPTPNPTPQPTLPPTNPPTNPPTSPPTPNPTPQPTPNPTPNPTPQPTPAPTPSPISPTNPPTSPPTPNPTPQPSPAPTPNPTPQPTPAPTPNPTPNPTPQPTPNPTPSPVPPTNPPTSPPTPNPTPQPTPAPTPNPTPNPTPQPTPAPTPSPISPQTCTADGASCSDDEDCCSGDCRGWWSSRTCRSSTCDSWWC